MVNVSTRTMNGLTVPSAIVIVFTSAGRRTGLVDCRSVQLDEPMLASREVQVADFGRDGATSVRGTSKAITRTRLESLALADERLGPSTAEDRASDRMVGKGQFGGGRPRRVGPNAVGSLRKSAQHPFQPESLIDNCPLTSTSLTTHPHLSRVNVGRHSDANPGVTTGDGVRAAGKHTDGERRRTRRDPIARSLPSVDNQSDRQQYDPGAQQAYAPPAPGEVRHHSIVRGVSADVHRGRVRHRIVVMVPATPGR